MATQLKFLVTHVHVQYYLIWSKYNPQLHKREKTYDVNGGVKHGARRGWVSKSTAMLGQRFILD